MTAIRFFQGSVSGADGDRCRFSPSCSEFTAQAIRETGLVRGIFLGADRLMRDNPYSPPSYLIRYEPERGAVYYDPLEEYWEGGSAGRRCGE